MFGIVHRLDASVRDSSELRRPWRHHLSRFSLLSCSFLDRRFGGTILPMVFSNRSHASGTVSISSGFDFLGGFAMRELPVVTKLSIALTREIGRVIVGHTLLEHCLSRITYKLIDVDPKIGRLAIREPRTADRLELIFDLTEVQGIQLKIDKTLYRDPVKA